jgi:hypothetical protein
MCFSPPPLRTRTNEMSGRETIRGISVLSAVKKLLFLQGWAQINGRDDIPIPKKVEYEEYDMKNKSFFLDLKILWLTFYIDAYGITTFSPPLFCCSGPVRMLKL